MKKRFQNQRFLTAGINQRIHPALQVLMWFMIEEVAEVDYLQIFELTGTVSGVEIRHSQEVPPYERGLFVRCEVAMDFSEKVYVIDDETHSTMLLAEEY